jgi:hypothetical protein
MAVLIGGISMHIPGRIKEPVRSLHPTKAMLKTLIMEETARGLRMQLFARPSFDISLLELFRNIPRISFPGMLSFLSSSRDGRDKYSDPLHLLIVPCISRYQCNVMSNAKIHASIILARFHVLGEVVVFFCTD